MRFRDRYNQRQAEKVSQAAAAASMQERINNISDAQHEQTIEDLERSSQASQTRQAERGLYTAENWQDLDYFISPNSADTTNADRRAEVQRAYDSGEITLQEYEQTMTGMEQGTMTGLRQASYTDEQLAQQHADLQRETAAAKSNLDTINESISLGLDVDPDVLAKAQTRYNTAVTAENSWMADTEKTYAGRAEWEYINDIGTRREDSQSGVEGGYGDMSRYLTMTDAERAEYNRLYRISPQRASDYLAFLDADLTARKGYTMAQRPIVEQYIEDRTKWHDENVERTQLALTDLEAAVVRGEQVDERAIEEARRRHSEAVAERARYLDNLPNLEQQRQDNEFQYVLDQSQQMGDYRPDTDLLQLAKDTGRTTLRAAGNAVSEVFDWIGQTDSAPSAAQYADDFTFQSYGNEGDNFLGTGRSAEQLVLGAGRTLGHMIPGWAASAINPVLGYAVMGATSGASGYDQALKEGMTNEQANIYGLVTGASEAAIGALLGGIGGRAGLSETKLLGKISLIDNAMKRVALTVGMNVLSEEAEEAIQNYAVEPVLRWALGVDYEAPTSQEVIEQVLLTAINAAVMSAGQSYRMGVDPSTFTRQYVQEEVDKAIKKAEKQDAKDQKVVDEIAARRAAESATQTAAAQPTATQTTPAAQPQSTVDIVAETAGIQQPQNPATQPTLQETQPTMPQTSTESLTQPLFTAETPQQQQVLSILSGEVTNRVAENIVKNPELRTAFETMTGRTIDGTASQQRTVVKRAAADMQAAQTQQVVQPTAPQMSPSAVDAVAQPMQTASMPIQQTAETQLPPGMGAASAGFSSQFDQWQQQTPEGGFHPVNEQAAYRMMDSRGRVIVEVPKKNQAGQLTPKTASTLMNAEMTPNAFVEVQMQKLAEGLFGTWAYGDGAAIEAAENYIRERGYEQALRDVLADIKSGKTSKDLTTRTVMLFNAAVNSGNIVDALDISSALINYSRELGRALQAINLINKLGPSAELYQISQSVDLWTEQLKAKFGDKANDLTIDPEDVKNFLAAKTDEEKTAARNVMLQHIADQMPASWQEKFQAWRYLSMLGNARTHIRNIFGNLGFVPVRFVKNVMATGLETIADIGGKLSENGGRTKAFLNYANPADRALVQAAFADYAQVEDIVGGDSKFDQDVREVQKLRRIYKNSVLEFMRTTNSNLLETEDVWFSKPAYAKALASYLKANNISAAEFMEETRKGSAATEDVTVRPPLKVGDRVRARDRDNIGTIVKDNGNGTYQVHFENSKGQQATVTLDGQLLVNRSKTTTLTGKPETRSDVVLRAREYAIKEAQKATYRDTNPLSKFLTGFRANVAPHFGNATPARAFDAGVNFLIEGVLPFKKTPANVLMRGFEYSPLGLMRDIYNITWAVRKGEKTAAQALDDFSQTLTGIGLVGLGYFMASQMMVTGGMGDDEEDRFRVMRGEQGYALVIGDSSYTIDWLAPAALPFFVGAELYNVVSSDKELSYDAVVESLKTIGGPMLELSMLQSLNDVLSAVGYADNPVVAVLTSAATSHLLQYFPTIGGQIERTFLEDERNTYYADRDTWLPGDLQYLLYQGANKLPFPGAEYNSIAYVDAWGRREETGSVVERFAENFLSPGYYSEDRSTPVDDELQRLYDEGYDVLPDRPSTSTQVSMGEGEEPRYMTGEEFVEYQEIRGQTALDILTDFMGSEEWQEMSDADRAEYVEKTYDYADEYAKLEVEPEGEYSGNLVGKAEASGLSTADYIYVTTVVGAEPKPIDKLGAISGLYGLSEAEKYDALSIYGSKSLVSYYSAAADAGLSFDEFTGIIEYCGRTDPTQAQIREYVARHYPNDPEKQKAVYDIFGWKTPY